MKWVSGRARSTGINLTARIKDGGTYRMSNDHEILSPLFQVGQSADQSQGHHPASSSSGGLSWSRSSSLRKHLGRRSLSSSRIDQVGGDTSNAHSNAIKVRQVIAD